MVERNALGVAGQIIIIEYQGKTNPKFRCGGRKKKKTRPAKRPRGGGDCFRERGG